MGVVAALLCGGAGRALAQLTPEQKHEAHDHYDKAVRAYDVQKFGEAIDEYQKTYEITGDPAMLFNVAQAYRLNGQQQEAVFYYRRYLERSPSAPNRADVEQKIAELDKAIEAAKATAATAPPPALPPPAAPAPAAAPAPPPPPVPVGLSPDDTSRKTKRVVGVTLLSIGGAGLLTAAIAGKVAQNKSDNLSYASTIKGTFDPSVEESGKRWDNVAVVSLVIGAGAAVAGGVFLLLARQPGSEAARPVASSAPSFGPFVAAGARAFGASAELSF